MTINPLAGKPATEVERVDIPRLVSAYYTQAPDPCVATQLRLFGTSGHRGSALERTFNEAHVLAISQAICEYRKQKGIDGPLFLGIDTHALSVPACSSALEVLAAHGVEVMLAERDEYTPTPVVSHAILPTTGGGEPDWPMGSSSRRRITRQPMAASSTTPERRSRRHRCHRLDPDARQRAVARVAVGREAHAARGALRHRTTHRHDYLNATSTSSGTSSTWRRFAVPVCTWVWIPWAARACTTGLPSPSAMASISTVVSEEVDPTFRFMTLDWDGRIRMDPSSPYAMQRLMAMKDRFDIAVACDTDHDRHGIVTRERRTHAGQSLPRGRHRSSVSLALTAGVPRPVSARRSSAAA